MVLRNSIHIIFSLILFCIVSCSDEKSPSKEMKTADGKSIYTKYCTVCHGDDGKKGLAGAKDLSASLLSKDEQVKIIRYGKNNMAGFNSTLEEEELTALAGYLEQLKTGGINAESN